MALSNIRREPRREITETLLGLVVGSGGAAIFLYFDHMLAVWLKSLQATTSQKDGDVIAFMFLAPMIATLASMLLFLIAIAIHNIGEGIANALAKRGLELRPRKRY